MPVFPWTSDLELTVEFSEIKFGSIFNAKCRPWVVNLVIDQTNLRLSDIGFWNWHFLQLTFFNVRISEKYELSFCDCFRFSFWIETYLVLSGFWFPVAIIILPKNIDLFCRKFYYFKIWTCAWIRCHRSLHYSNNHRL